LSLFAEDKCQDSNDVCNVGQRVEDEEQGLQQVRLLVLVAQANGHMLVRAVAMDSRALQKHLSARILIAHFILIKAQLLHFQLEGELGDVVNE